jgi:hypothetical protein
MARKYSQKGTVTFFTDHSLKSKKNTYNKNKPVYSKTNLNWGQFVESENHVVKTSANEGEANGD